MQDMLQGNVRGAPAPPSRPPPPARRPRPDLDTPTAEKDAWSRPALIAIVALAAGLMLLDVTRSGYGNTYYAEAAFAASHNWSALLTNAADLSDYVSLDKGPLSDWLMGLSGRLLGFGSFSVMVPNALYAIATVIVLYDAVRRALGRQIAILAALMMALTPVAVLVGRYNTPDALLLLLLVCAAWCSTVAIQSGRTRDLLLCATCVGLAFNTKMLEAYVVLPAFAIAFLAAGRRSPRRRLGGLAVAAGLMLIVSLAWFSAMTLVPAGDRPYVGDSTNNSWFQLIFEGDGTQRLAGHPGAFASHFERNILYLFSAHVSGQIAWLLPLALVGLVLGLLTTWRSRPASFASYLMWGAWAIVGCLVLSFSAGARHAYYTSLLAPAVATLAAAAIVTLWRLARGSSIAALGLAIAVIATSALSFSVLAHSGGFLPWLRWVVLACGVLTGAAVLASPTRTLSRGLATTLTAGAAAIAVLAGPAAYSLATVDRAHTGYDPLAGPAAGQHAPAVAVAHSGALTTPPLARSLSSLTAYLLAHRGDARFLVAATDAKTAAPIALATEMPVITVGGFSGVDPTPTAGQLVHLVSSGQLRYFLVDASRVSPASAAQRAISAPTWVERHCSRVPSATIAASTGAGTSRAGASIVSTLSLFACGSAA
jgi:4-amino-4-deoxy-L-arabinose transferase-like glycosyltransferase